LYLLTTTAREFFAGRGYRAIDRADAPERIRGTTEFSDLCPASATAMVKETE
jgi:amino-acid N-acetyltransferase